MPADDTLYIDADEEITSVIDKLKESPAETILLVVPKGASLLQSIVNLKLLRKEAENYQKNIALVTTDKVGRNLAAQVGLTVYEDAEKKELVVPPIQGDKPPVEDVIEVDMSEEGKKPPVPVHYYTGKAVESKPLTKVPEPLTRVDFGGKRSRKRMLIGFGLFILSLVGLLFFFPRTTVVLGVQSEPYESSIDLTLDKNTAELAENSSILPGQELLTEAEKTTTATATGKKTIGEKAKGSVVIYNCYQSVPLVLQKGKALTSSGKTYVTTADVTVPAATIIGTSCTAAGQATVNIEATAIGSESNLAADATFCVESYPCSGGTYVNAKNGTELQGGSSQQINFIQQEDIDAASNLARDELLRDAVNELKSDAGEKNLTVLDAAIDQQVTDKQSDKAAGTETNDVQVTTKVRVRSLAFNESDYRRLIVNLLSLRLPDGKELILSEKDEITIEVLETNWDQGFMKVRGTVKTRVVDNVDEDQAKNLVKNNSLPVAESKLKALPNIVEVTILTSPRFLNRTALFTRNITVKTEPK